MSSFMSKLYVRIQFLGRVILMISKVINVTKQTSARSQTAAWKVFEGKVDVTGGCNCDQGSLLSVEAYDYYENKWSF